MLSGRNDMNFNLRRWKLGEQLWLLYKKYRLTSIHDWNEIEIGIFYPTGLIFKISVENVSTKIKCLEYKSWSTDH